MPIDTVRQIAKGYIPEASSLAKFRYWHVEPLLNQASDLLDRCLKDRAEYNALRAQWETLRLQAEKAQRDQNIIDERVARGWLQLPSKQADNDASSTYEASLFAKFSFDELLLLKEADIWDTHGTAMPARLQLKLQSLDLQSRKIMLTAQSENTNLRAAWERNFEIAFRSREIESGKQALDDRLALMSGDGALNFTNQANAVATRMTGDLKDAIDRLTVAAKGLRLLYGYNTDLPDFSTSSFPLDDAVTWTRAVVRWLVAFGQLDQGLIRLFSVRSLIGDQTWTKEITLARTSGVFTSTFELPDSAFSSHKLVRVRSISAFVVGPSRVDPSWKAELLFPKSASIRLVGNQIGFIDQSGLPPCYIGRISTPDSTRPPELAGMISLMNASPIGASTNEGVFAIKLERNYGDSDRFISIDDLVIEFSVVGQPV